MEDTSISREEYIRTILRAYCNTPGTTGFVRRPDRLLAATLYQRGVPLIAVENALTLAAARLLFRPPDAPPLATIRSLAYLDRKSTRLNSSHVSISYAVFCLKKKII